MAKSNISGPSAGSEEEWPPTVPGSEVLPRFEPNGVPPLEEGPDPFDPDRLRLPQDFSLATGVKKALTILPVRGPSKEWFVRACPDTTYHLDTALIELKERGESYLVSPDIRDALEEESTLCKKRLFLAINRQGTLFFWPVRLPREDGRIDSWSKSAMDAAQRAITAWVRVTPNHNLQGYDLYYAEHVADPVWPELSMSKLLSIAFKDYYIATLDHPILRQLRGEV
jgi:hypothetical protein